MEATDDKALFSHGSQEMICFEKEDNSEVSNMTV